jgi:hypothetical protein
MGTRALSANVGYSRPLAAETAQGKQELELRSQGWLVRFRRGGGPGLCGTPQVLGFPRPGPRQGARPGSSPRLVALTSPPRRRPGTRE